MNLNQFKHNYLNHYLLLEKDFIETMQYVTVEKSNFETYSAVFLKLLLAVGSEIDIMLDFVSKLYDPSNSETGFGCSKVIWKFEKDITKLEIELIGKDITLVPWKSDEKYSTHIPIWWTVYNEIKHNRYGIAEKFDKTKRYYQYANLINILNSLAALYSLELYAYKFIANVENERIFVPTCKTIFTINNSHWKDISFGNGIVYYKEGIYLE